MKKTGRNELCPCGSGKKYKTCCLASTNDWDFQFRWFRQVYGKVIPKLIEFVSDHDPGLLLAAWVDFNDGETEESLDPDGPMNELFMSWFLFTWTIERQGAREADLSEITLAELFLQANESRLSRDEKMVLRSSIRCPYTLCEVVSTKPGVGLVLMDLLRRIQYEVSERTASNIVKRGEIIYCATSQVMGFRSNVGTGPVALRPTTKRNVLEFRKWMADEVGSDRLTAEHLDEFEADIRGFYLDEVKAKTTPPVIANMDGDPMVPQKLYFDIASADEAFHALKHVAEGESEEDLLKEAVVENGLITKASLSWLGGNPQARKRLGGPVLLGSLEIENERLVIEVNSQKRADRIRKIVEEALGDRATYKRSLIEPLEPRFRETWGTSTYKGRPSTGGVSPQTLPAGLSPPDEAAIREALEEIARQHWESWFDEPIPALNNMSPRKAAKTKNGRDLLESLLLEYESNASDVDNVFRPDMTMLRRKLGMD